MTKKPSFFGRDGIFVLLGFSLAIVSALAAFFVSSSILDHFYKNQQKAAIAQARGVLQVLTLDFKNFSDHLSDYSYWDETCAYIAGKNPTFLEKNFNATSLYFTRLDVVMVFDASFRFLGGVYDNQGGKIVGVPAEIVEKTTELRPLFDVLDTRNSRIGFLHSPLGTFMLVARPVANSHATGPAQGFLIFGRRLGEEQIQLLSTLTGMGIKLDVRKLPLPHEDGEVMESQTLGGSKILLSDRLEKGEKGMKTRVVLHDFQGETCFRLELTPPESVADAVRSISRLVRFFLIGVSVASALLALLTALEFRKRRQELNRRIRVQEELEQSRIQAEKLAERAQASDRAKDDFLAMISHEIRTPLNAIIGFAGLIERGKLDAEQASYLKNIHAGGELLLGIISDILDFSKINAGIVDINPQPHDLHELLASVMGLYASSAKKKGTCIEMRIFEDVPQFIQVDGIRLGQILGNLLSNAVKFTSEGTIRLSVARTPFFPGKENTGSVFLCFSVEDTGIGIPSEHRGKLFKSFSQVDSSRARHYGGTGLGLVICQRLVECMDGEIELRDSKTGTYIAFTLPVHAADMETKSSSEIERKPFSPSAGVLVIDDNPINAKLLQLILKKKIGVDSMHVSSGAEALRAHEAHHFRLLLMDLQMPDMDGIETTKRIREMERRHNFSPCHIVAVTAAATTGDRAACLAAGMDDYLTKPYRTEQLEGILKRYLAE